MKHYLLLLSLCCLILASCSSGKKAYQKGDYEKSVNNAVNRLRKAPSNKKAIQTLKLAYPSLLGYYQDQVAQFKNSSDPFKWEQVMGRYGALNQIYDEVQRSPAAKQALPDVQNFSNDYELALRKAVEARYQIGSTLLDTEGREEAKQAYTHFKWVDDRKPGFKDARTLMFEAQDLATVWVRIEPIPMQSRTFKLTTEFFQNNIAEFVANRTGSPFVAFMLPGQNNARSRNPDHILRMAFDDFVVGQAYVKETVRERVRDSVITGTVEVGDSTINAYGTVKAEVHCFQKEIASSGLLDLQILDARSKAVISQKKFPGTFVYYDKWGFYNGDKRALFEEDKEFMQRRKPLADPLPQDLFVEFTRPIYDQVTGYITEYYKRF